MPILVNLIKGFNSMELEDKKAHVFKNWNFVNIKENDFSYLIQILLSNDGLYLFDCKLHIGKGKQIVAFK